MTKKKAKAKLSSKANPDHSATLHRVRRIKGQIEGIERMIDERRYCPEILTQVQAASSALKSLASAILGSHLQHCVKDAMESKNQSETNKKIEEIIDLFKKG